MEWVNVTAKSLPEAIDLALDNLGVDEAEAEIEVLEEPKQGLFGRTRGNARVKARVKPRETRPKVERGRNRRRKGGSGDSGSGGRRGQNRGGGRDGGRENGGRDGGRDGGGRSERNERGGGGGNRDRNRSRSEKSGRDGGGGGDRSGRNRNTDGGNNKSNRNKNSQQRQPAQEAPVEEVSAQIETFLTGLTEAFGLDDGVKVVSDDNDGLVGQVQGRHGLLVGPKGRTLDAVQELTRVVVQRAAPSDIRIKVDVGGYREMRAQALQEFALKAADAAKADGTERSLEPMSSADRKVVHDALNGVDGIETRSAGVEPRRRVVVVPLVEAADGADDADDDEAGDDEDVEHTNGEVTDGGAEAMAAADDAVVAADDTDDDDDDDDEARNADGASEPVAE